jgi:hypothetical protein
LREAKPIDYPLKRITRRMTVKHGYLSNEIKKEDIRAVSEHLKGRLFYFPRGTDHAACIEEGRLKISGFRFSGMKPKRSWSNGCGSATKKLSASVIG